MVHSLIVDDVRKRQGPSLILLDGKGQQVSDDLVYTFPGTDQDTRNIKELIRAIAFDTVEEMVVPLHRVVCGFLFARPIDSVSAEYSKWNEPIECLIAVYALKEDGNFLPPSSITGLYARLFYHCRCAILYEAMLRLPEFQGDSIK